MQVKDIAVQGKLKEIAVQWKLKEIAVQYKQYRVKISQCHTNHSAMQGKDLAVQGLILVDFLGQELIFSRPHLAACSYREVVCGQSRNLFLHAALLIRLIIIAIIIITIWLQSGQ